MEQAAYKFVEPHTVHRHFTERSQALLNPVQSDSGVTPLNVQK